jgi:periplasmic protein TonB
MTQRICVSVRAQTCIWLRPFEGSCPHVGTRNAISTVHLLRLQEVPRGPQNAFIKCVMATCDHPSDLVHCIAYPSLGRPAFRTDWRIPALPPEEEKRSFASSSLQGVEAGDIFGESLIASGKSRPRNPWAVVGALAVQLLLLLALVVIPLFHTDPLPKREMLTMLYAPPAAASYATRLQAPAPTYTSTSIGIPAPIRRTQEAPPPPVDTTGGVVGGVPGGVPSEVLGSARSVPVLAKTPEPAPIKRIRVASRVAEANLIHDVAPQYPPEAGRARVEGTVVLMAVIGKDGSVQDVRVESGLPLLAQAAIDAVKQWRYRPYMLNGEPVEVDSRITINFTLSRG